MIHTPKRDNAMGAAQVASTAGDTFAAWQKRGQDAEERRKADPLGDGTKLAGWQPPASWGRIIERVPTRVRGIPAEMLRFANGQFVCRLVAVLHGLIGP
jgi:hypothetical protein